MNRRNANKRIPVSHNSLEIAGKKSIVLPVTTSTSIGITRAQVIWEKKKVRLNVFAKKQ